MDESLTITDGMYGTMEIEPILHTIMNTPEFQRLHNIKQLGITYRVYPGATHTRAVHSIGVCYLGHAMASSLGAKDVDLLCINIAALCHDLGHGPLSHQFNMYVHDVGNDDWTHEEQSIVMLHNIFQRLVGAEVWEKSKLSCNVDLENNKDVQYIYSLIRGERTTMWRPAEMLWTYDLINNTRNGIDVDRMDYILRDTSMTYGIPPPFDLKKILRGASISNDKTEIHYDIDATAELLRMSKHRFVLFDQLYTHPDIMALSFAMINGMHDINLPEFGEMVDADSYIHLTDMWVEQRLRDCTHIMDDIDRGVINTAEEVKTSEATEPIFLHKHVIYTDNITVCFRIDCGLSFTNPFGCLPETKYKTFIRSIANPNE